LIVSMTCPSRFQSASASSPRAQPLRITERR
jgi:hypothetical protein